MRSTKLLVYVTNDMIDFSQVNHDSFRKVIATFDVKKAIDEIVMILDFKATQMMIGMCTKFVGFPSQAPMDSRF